MKLKKYIFEEENAKEAEVVSRIGDVNCWMSQHAPDTSRSTPVAQSAPRNLLTRWDVSSIPANGIFLTKN